jgi:hypothetical protein
VDRGPPVEGWYVASPGCGAEPIRIAAVDLGAAVPEVEYWDERGPRKDLAFSVTQSDVELIELHASTTQSTVDWRVQVFYSGPRGEGVLTLHDTDGQPFRVSTETASDGYRPNFGGKAPAVVREHQWDANGIHRLLRAGATKATDWSHGALELAAAPADGTPNGAGEYTAKASASIASLLSKRRSS